MRQQIHNWPLDWLWKPVPGNVFVAYFTDSLPFFLASFLPAVAPAPTVIVEAAFTTWAGSCRLDTSGSAPFLLTSFVPHFCDFAETIRHIHIDNAAAENHSKTPQTSGTTKKFYPEGPKLNSLMAIVPSRVWGRNPCGSLEDKIYQKPNLFIANSNHNHLACVYTVSTCKRGSGPLKPCITPA